MKYLRARNLIEAGRQVGQTRVCLWRGWQPNLAPGEKPGKGSALKEGYATQLSAVTPLVGVLERLTLEPVFGWLL